MSRNNTGNPIGSKAFPDFEDNVKNLDQAVNSNELSWRDRLGRDRKSFEGMEREFDADQSSREARFNDFISASGYQFLGDYAAGLEITEYNQLVRDENGEFWRVSGQVDLPYVTTGTGMPEDGALVSVGDAVLRQDLADPDKGAAMVARGVVAASGVSVVSEIESEKHQHLHVGNEWTDKTFRFENGDLSGLVANDPLNLSAIPLPGSGGENGAWVSGGDIHDFSAHAAMLRKTRTERGGRAFNLWGPVVGVLGDSISHGAFSRDIYRNNWTSIVKRAWLSEMDSTSYGFQSINSSIGDGDTFSEELVKITTSGFSLLQRETAPESVTGAFRRSISAGSTVSFTVDADNRYVGLWYYDEPGNGGVSIEINGVPTFTLSTDIAAGNGRYLFTTQNNGRGVCDIVIRTTSAAPVKLSGISLHKNNSANPIFCNWSQSGRRLRWVDKAVIDEAAKCSALLLALGHNDMAQMETDQPYADAVRQRIDWIIDAVRAQGTQLYILDFCWTRNRNAKMRQELARLHRSLPTSVLVPFPEYFLPTSAAPTGAQMMTDMKLFDDASHPNIRGHQIIGEMVCRAMGLSIQSKTDALNYPLPRALTLATGWENAFSGYEHTGVYWVQGKVLNIQARICKPTRPSIGELANELVATIPTEFAPRRPFTAPMIQYLSGAIQYDGMITVNTTGEIRVSSVPEDPRVYIDLVFSIPI